MRYPKNSKVIYDKQKKDSDETVDLLICERLRADVLPVRNPPEWLPYHVWPLLLETYLTSSMWCSCNLPFYNIFDIVVYGKWLAVGGCVSLMIIFQISFSLLVVCLSYSQDDLGEWNYGNLSSFSLLPVCMVFLYTFMWLYFFLFVLYSCWYFCVSALVFQETREESGKK